MKRPQIILIAGSTVCLLLCGAAGWFYADALATAGRAREERERKNRDLEAVYKSNPFPDAQNTAQIREDLETLSTWTAAMHALCVSNNIPVGAELLNPISLSQHIQKTVPQLVALSNRGSRRVPDGFPFGFDRYLPPSSVMPERDNAERLALQFTLVEMLVRLVMSTDIQQLTEFSREVFEERGGASPRSAQAPQPGAGGSNIASRERFTLRFTARQETLQNLLNLLSATPAFITVSSVRAAKVNPADVAPPAADLRAQVKPEDAPVKPGELHFPVEVLRVMTGPSVSSLLDIALEMDILTFFPTPN